MQIQYTLVLFKDEKKKKPAEPCSKMNDLLSTCVYFVLSMPAKIS